jgi:uroporphyrin-III C-methyltransferase
MPACLRTRLSQPQHATLPTQRVATATLAGLVAMVEREQISSPAILIIGEVARNAGLQALAGPAPKRALGTRASAPGPG